jgi:hypothetical protein
MKFEEGFVKLCFNLDEISYNVKLNTHTAETANP